MIGYIRGKIKYISDNSIVLGEPIGFSVNVGSKSYSVDDEVELFTHMVVRENEISLWGFKSELELSIFKLLINISGVGPRISQSLICNKGIDAIISAVMNDKPEVLKSTGVGAKTAQKIVLELKGKLNEGLYSNLMLGESLKENSLAEESLMALQSLGYKQSDLLPIISKVIKGNPEISSTEEVIKLVLKSI